MKSGCVLAPILALATLSAHSAPTSDAALSAISWTASAPEQNYLQARDAFIKKFSHATDNVDAADAADTHALAALQKQLQAIVGPAAIRGYTGPGTISLATLQPHEEGFGMIDGLRFGTADDALFVTTPGLLASYLKAHSKLPRNLDGLARSGAFLLEAFDTEADVYNFGDIPVTVPPGKTFAHAILALSAQDIGAYEPTELFVLVAGPDRIAIVQLTLKKPTPAIPECTHIWDKYEAMKNTAFKAYKQSGLKDQKKFDESERDEQQGFEAFRACYAGKVAGQGFFAGVVKQSLEVLGRMGGPKT